jgi:hypothetical protein
MDKKFTRNFKSNKETELEYMLRLYGNSGPLEIIGCKTNSDKEEENE